ncbi:MAG: hypothetical protein ACR5LD_06795 [Symbiopectobacterium sp.]
MLFSHQWLCNEPEDVVLALQPYSLTALQAPALQPYSLTATCCRIRFQAWETLFREGNKMRYCPL